MVPTPKESRKLSKAPNIKKPACRRRKFASVDEATVAIREQVQLRCTRIVEIKAKNEAREQEFRARQTELLVKLLVDSKAGKESIDPDLERAD
jgi:hypothetical protein